MPTEKRLKANEKRKNKMKKSVQKRKFRANRHTRERARDDDDDSVLCQLYVWMFVYSPFPAIMAHIFEFNVHLPLSKGASCKYTSENVYSVHT